MTTRQKLLILLLSISLIPLIAYFTLNFSFSRIARNRVQQSLSGALDSFARIEILQVIGNYEGQLRSSAQAVHYGLRHYADSLQHALLSTGAEPTSQTSYMTTPDSLDLTGQDRKYASLDAEATQRGVDFDAQIIAPSHRDSNPSLVAALSKLSDKCKEIYSINPQTRLWIYTVFDDGPAALYPSPGLWPYPEDYDLRNEQWYKQVKNRSRYSPMPRIEPLTGHTVLTVPVPMLDADNVFIGAVAMDIDLSAGLDMVQIPPQWRLGAWRMLMRLSEPGSAGPLELIIAGQFEGDPNRPLRQAETLTENEISQIEEYLAQRDHTRAELVREPFRGVDSLWACSSSNARGGMLVLIVPYQRIIEQAEITRRMLFRDNIRGVQTATVLIFTVILIAVLLAVVRAHRLTVPITHLVGAASKLADGDFDTTVTIETGDELQHLGQVFNQVGSALKERERMRQSIELAQQIQQHFLPAGNPRLSNFEVAGICLYCDETGGDYYDFIDLGDDRNARLGLVLGDISGHGIGAAMLMISAGSVLRNNAPAHGCDLSKALAELNRHLTANSETGKFMTMFYAILDDNERTLSWASAGHEPTIWYHGQTGDFSELPSTALPLGITEDAEFEQAGPVSLASGDIMVLGTDGISEALNGDDVMYGRDRLLQVIQSRNLQSAEQIAASVVDSVLQFCGDAPIRDDITLVVLKAL